jgi:prepilin-type processing-associated H-X9-DG protein
VANAFLEKVRESNWVLGVLDYSTNSGNTDPENIRDAALFRYAGDVRVYRCPSDPSGIVLPGGWTRRTRSYSLNGWMGENASGWPPAYTSPAFQVMERLDEIADPDGTFVFLDEHPDSINDGAFMVEVEARRAETRIIDFPGSHHRGGAHLGFADGSVRFWRWRDPRTALPIQLESMPLNVSSPSNPDIARLAEITTFRR